MNQDDDSFMSNVPMSAHELRAVLDGAPPGAIVRVFVGERLLTLTQALVAPPHRVEIGNLPVEVELFATDLIHGWTGD
jgi:hypothetical protein